MKTILSFAVLAIFYCTASAQKSVDLKYNLEPNKTYKVKYTSVQNRVQTAQGMQFTSDVNSDLVFSIKPLKNEDSVIICEVRFDTIKTLSNTSNMPSMEINSSEPGNIKSSDPAEALGCITNRLSKSAFLAKMTNTGHILEIMNIQQISKNILSGVDSIPGQMGPFIKSQAEMMVSESTLKGMIESVTAYLPGKEVGAGDTWKSEINLSAGGMSMLITTDYKLNELNKKTAEISGEMVVEPAGSDPMVINGAEITMDIRGIGKTNLTVDTKTGWILKGTLKQQMKGDMFVSAPGTSMQIPTEINSESTIVSLTD
jgi:hypothetical protein